MAGRLGAVLTRAPAALAARRRSAADSGRVTLFLPSLESGGAERVMLHVAGALVDRLTPVDLVLAKAEGPYLPMVPPGVRVVDLRAARLRGSLPGLVRYLRAERPVALLATLTHANVLALVARRLARVPTRVVVREANTLSLASVRAVTTAERLLPAMVRHCYPWADEIACVSVAAARDLARVARIPVARIRVLYSPIVPPELDELAAAPPEHPWLATGTVPVVLGVGRLAAQKDFPTLIRAFAELRRRRPARLVILGDGPDRAALEALVAELRLADDVAFPGFVANPFAYMSRAAVFALSSAWEGLPGALVQALACGTPVVATDCESGPREVLRDGRFGQLVPVRDVGALAAAMERAIASPRDRMPDESWRPFTPGATVDAYLQLLRAPAPVLS